jgi:hypothetical protein
VNTVFCVAKTDCVALSHRYTKGLSFGPPCLIASSHIYGAVPQHNATRITSSAGCATTSQLKFGNCGSSLARDAYGLDMFIRSPPRWTVEALQ